MRAYCLSLDMCIHMLCRGQHCCDSLELELQVIVSRMKLIWALNLGPLSEQQKHLSITCF